MTRVIKTTRNRTASMGAALLALGAGAALLGASCDLSFRCRGPGCPEPITGTCPWHCAETVWDGTSSSVEGFSNADVFAVWVGSPREAPDCESSNYFHARDYYQEPKSIDRCPRCVAEPRTEELYESVTLRKGGHCGDDTYAGAPVVGAFVVPAGWDGSCVSQRSDVFPAPEDVDFAMASGESAAWDCRASLSLEDVDALWGKVVRTCRRFWHLDQDCEDIDALCIPEMAPGFRECLEYRGDDELQACPRSHPELVQAHIDVSGCTRCETNGISASTERKWMLTFYADEQCTQPMPSIDTWGDGRCIDLPPGASPRSVSATLTVESLAECVPRGGEQEGELGPGDLVSFCCRPPA
ncbi:hypothetical protein [Sorangium cellulosum]|uniref:Uncharacterized protein n=1 Tax=Sorangium cellulosum So0157-2 TaxID=1254432 RepID=S4XKH7_SORCE|nr:hypothetical protein [Sorangium cellulosum]AGP33687.1 hypothetical protein SCE1572_03750 [Sorangium cellulosum So0157-2]